MTLPYQRTRAVLDTREFLVRLCSPYGPDGIKKIPAPVRAQARALLKHFPLPGDLMRPGQWDSKTVDDYHGERALRADSALIEWLADLADKRNGRQDDSSSCDR